jgi:hypothetical protein
MNSSDFFKFLVNAYFCGAKSHHQKPLDKNDFNIIKISCWPLTQKYFKLFNMFCTWRKKRIFVGFGNENKDSGVVRQK